MTTPFQHSYLPNTEAQRQAMLRTIGAASVDELFDDIPAEFRDAPLDLPPALSEMELQQELTAISQENLVPGDYACFLGGGAYRHFVPSVVRAIVSRGELLTSYTPYQPEVSQGTLQATYDFQTMVCLLTGMEVANAGMYDGATSLAEAALMACRITGRSTVAVLDTVHPRHREVVSTYTASQGIRVVTVSEGSVHVDRETACPADPSTPTSWGPFTTLLHTGTPPTPRGPCWWSAPTPRRSGCSRRRGATTRTSSPATASPLAPGSASVDPT